MQKDLAKRRQQVLEGEICAFRKDLKDDMYKDAEVKYKDKIIQLRVRHSLSDYHNHVKNLVCGV